MDINQFTIKSQEAIKNAEEIAKQNGNQSIENVHLLKALIKSDDYLIPNLFTKLGVNVNIFNQALDKIISSLLFAAGLVIFVKENLKTKIRRRNV